MTDTHAHLIAEIAGWKDQLAREMDKSDRLRAEIGVLRVENELLRRRVDILEKLGSSQSVAAVDPHADSTGTLSTREKGIA